jgi:hypothetical protein
MEACGVVEARSDHAGPTEIGSESGDNCTSISMSTRLSRLTQGLLLFSKAGLGRQQNIARVRWCQF